MLRSAFDSFCPSEGAKGRECVCFPSSPPLSYKTRLVAFEVTQGHRPKRLSPADIARSMIIPLTTPHFKKPSRWITSLQTVNNRIQAVCSMAQELHVKQKHRLVRFGLLTKRAIYAWQGRVSSARTDRAFYLTTLVPLLNFIFTQ